MSDWESEEDDMNANTRRKTLLGFSTILALTFCATARAQSNCPTPPTGGPPTCTIAAGSDFFTTQTGTYFNFGSPIGTVDFKGVPINPSMWGNTDTIVQRLNDPNVTPGGPPVTINTMLTNLSLESSAPVSLGGNAYDVFVTLNPADLALDTGQLQVSLDAAANGGTYSSTLNVYFEAQFTQVGNPSNTFDVPDNVTLSGNGEWSTTPASGTFLLYGPFGDIGADIHTGLPDGEVDFFPCTTPGGGPFVSPCIETAPGDAHSVDPTVPEPGSIILLATGLLGLVILRRRTLLAGARG
jgi:hypothetical protein